MSEAAKHTPGPWYWTASSSAGTVYAQENHQLIVPHHPDGADENTFANARLIASAPELLQALILAEGLIYPNVNPHHARPSSNSEVLHTIRAAIAKATGDKA